MATLLVDSLRFTFLPSIEAQKYDDSQHYRTVWQLQGRTAVDIVAMKMAAVPDRVWLIEAKDFRVVRGVPKPSNVQGLAQTIATNVADTLAGLEHAAANAIDPDEKEYATRATSAGQTRIVLHLEPHSGPHTKLFPANFSSGVLQKLKQLVKGIDPNPLVLNIANTTMARVPWAVS
jgi:hypothetical protein